MSTSSNETRLDHEEVKFSSEIDPALLIEDHQTGIWRYLRSLGRESNEAEDLTQETFLAVLRKPFEYYGKAAAAAYLRKVAYHRFISARRRSGKEVVTAELERIDESWSSWLNQREDGSEALDALGLCLKQLGERALAFEVSHPHLTNVVASITDLLASIGHGDRRVGRYQRFAQLPTEPAKLTRSTSAKR